MLRNAATALAVFLVAGQAQGQAQCGDTLVIYEQLKSQYGEQRFVSGFDANERLVEWWGNPSTGTFTALVTHPEGRSCIFSVGQHFQVETHPEPAGKRL